MVLAATVPNPVFAQKKILLQATFNPTQTDQGVAVSITGRVSDNNNVSIPNAAISIEVNDPQGTSVHVAVAYTTQQGIFQDSFPIPVNSPGGNYTAFLVAVKPGFDTARVNLIFSYSSPDFSIQPSTRTLSLQQGETGALSVTIIPLRGFRVAVNLTALELPPGVTLQVNPSAIVPGGTASVRLTVSSLAPVGNYTITLLGISGSTTHRVSLQLKVNQGPLELIYLFAIIAATLLAALFLLLRQRSQQKQRLAAVEGLIRQTPADEGYVATARAIARLEELRALNKVDEATYQRLKREYEKQLEKSR